MANGFRDKGVPLYSAVAPYDDCENIQIQIKYSSCYNFISGLYQSDQVVSLVLVG